MSKMRILARSPAKTGETRFFIYGGRFRAVSRTARQENGGAYRDRTDDLMLAKQPLSQLS